MNLNILDRFKKKSIPQTTDNKIGLNVATQSKGIQGTDTNYDGMPDYLQREILPSLIKENKDLNRWDAETYEDVEQLIMNLRGYEYNPSTEKYHPISPPVMNEIGIRKIQQHFRPIVNKHSINTFIENDEMHKDIELYQKEFIRWMKFNAKLIEISYSDLSTVCLQVDALITATMRRSIGDRQRQHTTNRTKLTGNLNPPAPTFPG